MSEKPINEQKIEFNSISDKDLFVVSTETGDSLMEITGFDVQFKFNFSLINNSSDLDALGNGISEMFKKMAQDALLKGQDSNKKD